MPPESWARFPSHTREERTGSAGVQDNVNLKDFAIKDTKEGVIESIKRDRKPHHRHHEKEQHHSLPIRVSKQIRASLYKLRTTKSAVMSNAIRGRKSTVSVGGMLEYPELELLAGKIAGNQLLEETEREIEAEMRRAERAARMVVFGDGGIDREAEGDPEVGETSQVSIADPKFYEDCVTLPLGDDEDNDKAGERWHDSPPLVQGITKKEKYGTWSGRDRVAKGFMDNLVLRRSTVDFQMEVEKMESLERDRAIRSAQEAWGPN
jgi:hypothetical protein